MRKSTNKIHNTIIKNLTLQDKDKENSIT